MAVTRSTTKRSWPDLNHDMLLIVRMQLGIFDFLAFSGTCKKWRSFARSNKKEFMGSRLPLEISCDKKYYCLQDYQGRKFKTVLPHSTGRLYVGFTCGYFILFGCETRDFWLVNPITRHELHFNDLPDDFDYNPTQVRAMLVYSPSMSECVFVISSRRSRIIWFRSAGKKTCWDNLVTNIAIDDLNAFQGNIYIIYGFGSLLCEMRLHPYPILKLLEMKNSPVSVFFSEFVSSGENLYVLGYSGRGPCRVLKLDFDELIWVSSEKTIGGLAFFLCEFKNNAAIKSDTWAESSTEYERLVHFPPNKSQRGSPFDLSNWYFPHECLNDNRLREG